MPLYEFGCKDCGAEFEELVRSSSEAAQVECPKCLSRKVERLQSGFATIGSCGSGKGTSTQGSSSCGSRGGFT